MVGKKQKNSQSNPSGQNNVAQSTGSQTIRLDNISFAMDALPASMLKRVSVAEVYVCKAPDGSTKYMGYQAVVELSRQGLQPQGLCYAFYKVDEIKDGIIKLGRRLDPAGETYWKDLYKGSRQRDHELIIEVPFADRDPNEQQYGSNVFNDDALRSALQVAFSASEIDAILARLHGAPNNGAPTQPSQPATAPMSYPSHYPPYPYPLQPTQPGQQPPTGAPMPVTSEEVARVLAEVLGNPDGHVGRHVLGTLYDVQARQDQFAGDEGETPVPRAPQTP